MDEVVVLVVGNLLGFGELGGKGLLKKGVFLPDQRISLADGF